MSIINNKILILNYHVILQRQMDEKKKSERNFFLLSNIKIFTVKNLVLKWAIKKSMKPSSKVFKYVISKTNKHTEKNADVEMKHQSCSPYSMFICLMQTVITFECYMRWITNGIKTQSNQHRTHDVEVN